MANPFTMKTAGSSIMPGEWDAQQREIDAQRKYADLLAQQGMETGPQGSMVSGVYVAPSWTQNLAHALKGWQAKQLRESANKEAGDMANRRNQALAQTMAEYARLSQGSPAEMAPSMALQPGPDGAPRQVETRPAVAPNRAAALAELMKNPDTAPIALQAQMTQMMKADEPIVVGRTLKTRSGQTIGVDETWQEEQRASREAKKAELEARLADQRLSREDRAALMREQMALRREMVESTRAAGREKAPAGYRFGPDGSLSPIPGGPADPKTKTGADGMPKLTEAQGKANLYQSRATESDKIIKELEGQYSPLAINAKQGLGKTWLVGGALESAANSALPAKTQQVEQAQRDFVNAILRQESGAVIADSEFANAQKQYFPQPGDSKAVIDQKRKNRETAIAGLRVMAGPAARNNSAGFTVLGVESE